MWKKESKKQQHINALIKQKKEEGKANSKTTLLNSSEFFKGAHTKYIKCFKFPNFQFRN